MGGHSKSNEEKLMSITSTGRLKLAKGLALILGATVSLAWAQEKPPASAPQLDTTTIDDDGTAHITRVIPVPGTVSPEAQKAISWRPPDHWPPTLAEQRAGTDAFRKSRSEEARKLFPVKIEEKVLGGVRTDIITPPSIPRGKRDRVLINLHGGGFVTDSGSLVEGIPIASLTQTTVVSVYYRLAPESPFPAAVDDAVAVYRELLKTHKPRDMGLFGTSAGAILTAEVAAKLRQLGLPLPAALGIFSGTGDLSQAADSEAFFTIWGLGGEFEAAFEGPPS